MNATNERNVWTYCRDAMHGVSTDQKCLYELITYICDA